MKRGKKLLFLLLALAVISAAAAAATLLAPDETADENASAVIFTLDTDAITALTWTYDGETVALSHEDDSWSYEDPGCPIDQSYPENMAFALEEITSDRTIEAPEDLSEYGLDDPQCTIDVTAGENSYQLLIGDETTLDGLLYLSTGDGNVYLVSSSLLNAFSYGLYDIIQTESIPSITDVSSFTIERASDSLEMVYLEDSGLAYSSEYVWFLRDGEDYLTLDTDGTEDLLSSVADLNWLSCVSYDATDDDLAAYGLDAPAVTVTIHYTETAAVDTGETDEDGNAVTEEQERDVTFTLELGSYTDDGCYARIAGSSMVYLVDGSVCDGLLYATYDGLRPDEVLAMDWDALTSFTVIVDGQTYEIEKTTQTVEDEEGKTSEETVYLLDGEEMDTEIVEQLMSSLDAMESTGSAEGADPGVQELRFTFHQDSESWPQVELVFYQYDSSSCLVSLNGETRLLVDRADVTELAEMVAELLPE